MSKTILEIKNSEIDPRMACIAGLETMHPGDRVARERLESKQRLDLQHREVLKAPEALVAYSEGRMRLHVKNYFRNKKFRN